MIIIIIHIIAMDRHIYLVELLLHAFDHTAHGYQDLRKAFANSCNSAFSTIGAGLNKTSFMNLCSTLLFNSNLPVGFEYSKSTMAVTQDSFDK